MTLTQVMALASDKEYTAWIVPWPFILHIRLLSLWVPCALLRTGFNTLRPLFHSPLFCHSQKIRQLFNDADQFPIIR